MNKKLNIAAVFLIITVIAILGALTAMSGVSADEIELPVVTVENKTVHRGQTFELTVTLDENPGLIAMLLELDYDTTAMMLTDIKCGSALSGMTFTIPPVQEDGYTWRPFNMLWDGRTPESTKGTLLTLTFESFITAPIGDYTVTLTYNAQNTNSDYGKPIPVVIHNGTVTLISGEFSAEYINYDGSVLFSKDYNSGEAPAYSGEIPQRPTDDCYSYEFTGWQGVASNKENTLVYTAKYKGIPNVYQVFFYVDGEYYNAAEIAYGEVISESSPFKKDYTFVGWFTDEGYTERLATETMPANNLTLHGFFKFNIRETPIPKIELRLSEIVNGIAKVEAYIVENPSISGMILTLDYNTTGLKLCGFENGTALEELQFDNTRTDEGFDYSPFKFYWEGAQNITETGLLLTLYFTVDETVTPGNYHVGFTYEPTSDATYFNAADELLYSMLEIVNANVPIGKIFEWTKPYGNDNEIINVVSNVGMSPDVVLEVIVVSKEVSITEEQIKETAGKDMKLTEAYSISLLQNGVSVAPNGELTVRIKLNSEQQACKKIVLYYITDDGQFVLHESKRDGEFIVFITDHLSCWAIVGDETAGILMSGSVRMERLLLSLLAIVCICYILVLIIRHRRRNGMTYCISENNLEEVKHDNK